ncbi:hypothetical protein PM082_014714 [Marasmius tenuissimus]|nr:hypothetical protein PM082_014714 [Marasmius tenuissimus]
MEVPRSVLIGHAIYTVFIDIRQRFLAVCTPWDWVYTGAGRATGYRYISRAISDTVSIITYLILPDRIASFVQSLTAVSSPHHSEHETNTETHRVVDNNSLQ